MENNNKIGGFVKATKVISTILSVFAWISLICACLGIVLSFFGGLFGGLAGDISDLDLSSIIVDTFSVAISSMSMILAASFYNKIMGKKDAKLLFASLMIFGVSYLLCIIPFLFENMSVYSVLCIAIYAMVAVVVFFIGFFIKDLSLDNHKKLKVLVISLLVLRGLLAFVHETLNTYSIGFSVIGIFVFLINFAVGIFIFLPLVFYVFLYPQIENLGK